MALQLGARVESGDWGWGCTADCRCRMEMGQKAKRRLTANPDSICLRTRICGQNPRIDADAIFRDLHNSGQDMAYWDCTP